MRLNFVGRSFCVLALSVGSVACTEAAPVSASVKKPPEATAVRKPAEATTVNAPAEAVAVTAPAEVKVPVDAGAPKRPPDASAAKKPALVLNGDLVKGEAKFKQLCVACHGEKGAGDGAAAAALNPKPASFVDSKRAGEITDEYVLGMIRDGGAANGRSPLMVSWKASMSEAELIDVATYVRSLSKKPARKSTVQPKKG